MIENTTFIITKDFCATIKKHLKPFVIGTLATNNIRRMAYEFEELQGIFYVFEVVNGSHILIKFIMGSNILHKKGHMCLYF
jgi:hypothetical protein